MEQPLPSSSESPILSPYKYPIWVKGFGILIVAAALASVVISAPYFVANRQMMVARKAAYREDYQTSGAVYSEVLKNFPQAFEARLGFAESLFSQHNQEADQQALKLLEGARIDEVDWARLQKVMPEQYQEAFRPVKNQSTVSKPKSSSAETSPAEAPR